MTRPWVDAWIAGTHPDTDGVRRYNQATIELVIAALEATTDRTQFEDSLLRSFRLELETMQP